MMEKEYLLYITVNKVNGKVYGGQHIGYKTDNYIGSGTTIFLKAVKKYGKENFTRRWLKLKIDSKKKLDKLERILIRRLKYKFGKNCYNIHAGGTGGYMLDYCDKEYRDSVFQRISSSKKEQYKRGATHLQILGRKRQSEILKYRHKNDEEFRKKHVQKCKENSEKLRSFYQKNGQSENQKKWIEKLKKDGHFKLRIKVTHPDGNIEEHVYNYTKFMEELKIEGEFFSMLNRGEKFKIKRRTKMTSHNFEVGCEFEMIERIDD